MLIRRVSETGIIQPIAWDYCVQTTWVREDDKDDVKTVLLNGWISAHKAKQSMYCKAMKGNHKNLMVENNQLESMSELKMLVESWKEIGNYRKQQ